MIKIQPGYCVCYNEYIGNRTKDFSKISLDNLTENKHKGNLSDKAIKRLYNALDWLLIIAKNKTADKLKGPGSFNYKLAMLTLTLPCAQLHDDLYIKKYMLNEFLTIIRKKFNLQNYIWKAEKQQNGSIHFHLIIDKYIFYKDINNVWNNILTTHGYINQYRLNQEKKHEHGFFYDKKISTSWNKSKQLAAYKNGFKTHWSCPTGTTDIHSLKKIKNTRAYLAKYITKNPDVSKACAEYNDKYNQRYNVQYTPPKIQEEIRKEVKKKLSVQGNLWYISQSLSKLKGAIIEVSNAIGKELNWFRAKFKEKVLFKDFCAIYKFSIKDIFKFKFTQIMDLVKNYVYNLRDLFYPPGEPIGSPLGIPLNIFESN